MRLAAELTTSPFAALRALAPGTPPLVSTIEQFTMPWIRTAAALVRHGVHANTAFGPALIIEAARSPELSGRDDACSSAARRWFLDDRDWPADWELSGRDFPPPASPRPT